MTPDGLVGHEGNIKVDGVGNQWRGSLYGIRTELGMNGGVGDQG